MTELPGMWESSDLSGGQTDTGLDVIPDVKLAGSWQITFYPVDAAHSDIVTISLDPGRVANTVQLSLYHNNRFISEHEIRLPNYREGSVIKL